MSVNTHTSQVEYFTGKLISHHREGSLLHCRSANKVLIRVEFYTPEIVRVRYGTDSYFENDFSYAIDEKFSKTKCDLKLADGDKELIFSSESVTISIRKADCQLSFQDPNGELINRDEKGFHWQFQEKTGNNIVKMTKEVQSPESYFGLGDKPVELNLISSRFQNWGSDTYGYDYGADPLYKNIPFYYGLHHDIAYGIFFDNSFRSYFDFAKERSEACSFWAHGGEMNYYFIAGPQLIDVASRYAQLTGTSEMPAMWSLGFQQCKWSYYPESEVRDVTSKMREYEIPCDAIYLDIDYMDGFRCFTWDYEKFPDPKKMIDDLREDGFKTMVIIDPGIKKDESYWVFKEGLENGYFCRRPDGPYVEGIVWPDECYFPDFTNPKVRDWWAGLYKGLIEDMGVAGVWNDMNEPALFEVDTKTFPTDVRHNYDGNFCSHLKAHNVYGMQMARATYEGVKRFSNNKRGLIISRSGYSGLQRYSSVWTGDNIASWRHLWLANVQAQRLSISGISFVGSDIGGFIGKPSPELFVRWIQLAIFHPFCRVHSSQDDGDQEPWSFGEAARLLFKKAIELRYQMLPYHYTAFYRYHKKGIPILKPISFMDQSDIETHFRDHEFVCGDHILSASITKEHALSKEVYLPKGTWFDYWTNELFQGARLINMPLSIEIFPMFVKAGAILPFYPVQQYVDQLSFKELSLKCYYTSEEETSYFYEDAHDGYEYQEGDFRYSRFLMQGVSNGLIIEQDVEGSFTTRYQHYRISLIGLPKSAKSIHVDGKEWGLTDPLFPIAFKHMIIRW